MPTRVFVSYSHADRKKLNTFDAFLAPLERDGIIEAWDDTRLKPGEDWYQEIDQALDRASLGVVFVSPTFLASKFIYDVEMPRILARRAAGDLTLLPVFLRPSNADEVAFPFTDETGTRREVSLTDIQGVGDPAKGLTGLRLHKREQEYKALASRIRELASQSHPDQPTATGPAPTSMATTARVTSGDPGGLYELSVHLRREGGTLHVDYELPGRGMLAPRALPWPEVQARLDPIADALDTARPAVLANAIAKAPTDWGQALFEVLFGAPQDWQPVLRALFHQAEPQPAPTPIRSPVRLRVVATDGLLVGMPWRLLAWNHRLLIQEGWVVHMAPTSGAHAEPFSSAPFHVVVLAPLDTLEEGGVVAQHLTALREVLAQAWPATEPRNVLRIVGSRKELEHALAGMAPHLLYVVARMDFRAGRWFLPLNGKRGGDFLDLDDLPQLLKVAGSTPAVIYLNTSVPDAGSRHPLSEPPARPLSPPASLVLWRRLHEWNASAFTVPLDWLHRWLVKGLDPMEALHDVQRQAPSDETEATTVAIHADYHTWDTAIYAGADTLGAELAHLVLDREEAKAVVARQLRDLAASESRRVLGLVAYAAPGNMLGSLTEQFRFELEREMADRVAIEWLKLSFPANRTDLYQGLQDQLRLLLRADPGEPTHALLRRHAPHSPDPAVRPVLWLDWGLFGEGHQSTVSPVELTACLRFASQYLGQHCPTNLRLVSSLAIETEGRNHDRLRKALKELRRQPWAWDERFRLDARAVGDVDDNHLLELLADPRAGCDPAIRPELVGLMLKTTGGRFERTVDLIREGLNTRWYALLTRLRGDEGPPPPGDDTPF
jgi:hypothetical protein